MIAAGKFVQQVIEQGIQEAHDDRSPVVEAHHLLLAIAADPEGDPARTLASIGLDRQSIRAALDHEFEHSLRTVGVSLTDFELPRPANSPEPPNQLGASAKIALERGFASAARKKDLRPAHLLLGILQAEVGTVPRALALAGVDRSELMVRVLHTLTDTSD